MDSHLTANSELISTLHDRERRVERQIDKITLQEARRYGMAEKSCKGRIRYTYAGHVFIYDPQLNKAITSWKIDPNNPHNYGGKNSTNNSSKQRKKKVKKEPKSGTRFFKPIMIQQSNDHEDIEVQVSHETISNQVHAKKGQWTSHTVLVVDMSGSMRDDDIDGARCRSDGVWTTLARDFVKGQLENKTCSVYDLVSVVIMRSTAQVVIEYEPITYVLYNKLVKFREWDNLKPQGHGYYKPALKAAEDLLSINASGSCALTLMFFSDGKPSDYHQFRDDQAEFDYKEYKRTNDELVEMAGGIASKFGRRLNIEFVGMAGEDEDFTTMKRMAEEAKVFGSQASFNRPNLTSESLSQIVSSSLASSLASKTELTSLKTGSSRSVRTDVERERGNAPDDKKVNDDWRIFQSKGDESYVLRVWTWNPKVNDFALVIDPRCSSCYKTVADASYTIVPEGGTICDGCRTRYFCSRCTLIGMYRKHRCSQECSDSADERRKGFVVGGSKCPMSYSVAWKKKAFGEGAERLAFKFRFLNSRNKFIGPVMVAKESRFVEDINDDSATNYLHSHRHHYHKSFMRTQATASKFASLFNESLGKLDQLICIRYPNISFIDPMIFELEDGETGKIYNILVEPMIEGTYKKFSNNFRALTTDVKRDFSEENRGVDLQDAALLLGRNYEPNEAKPIAQNAYLDIIEEGSEDEEESDDTDSNSVSEEDYDGYSLSEKVDTSKLRDTDYLEAFSHFTYVRSGGKFMVVDLQGSLQTNNTNGQKVFILTDPAIHFKHSRGRKTREYGRTDLGRKGMRAFFESHQCNGICRLFQFREKKEQKELDNLYNFDKKK